MPTNTSLLLSILFALKKKKKRVFPESLRYMQKIRRINAEQKKSHMLVLNNNTHSTALKTAHD